MLFVDGSIYRLHGNMCMRLFQWPSKQWQPQSVDLLMIEPHICRFLWLTCRLEDTFRAIMRVFKIRNYMQDGSNLYTVCQSVRVPETMPHLCILSHFICQCPLTLCMDSNTYRICGHVRTSVPCLFCF